MLFVISRTQKIIKLFFAFAITIAKEVINMFESMPGGDPIILDRVPALLYCGGCMAEMKCIHGSLFACPLCGRDYHKEMVA